MRHAFTHLIFHGPTPPIELSFHPSFVTLAGLGSSDDNILPRPPQPELFLQFWGQELLVFLSWTISTACAWR